MSQLWITADFHIGHRKIWEEYEAEARPFSTQEEHDEALVERWNSVVRKRDTVWHLGDFCMNKKAIRDYVPRLNGRIKLVLGNHDAGLAKEYADMYFGDRRIKIYGPTKMRGNVLFSHIPVHPSCMGTRFRVNVHGHLHLKEVMAPRAYGVMGEVLPLRRDDRYICVSAGQSDLTPIPYETVRGWIRERGLGE